MVKSLREWMEENNGVLSEVAPPGFSGTIVAMQTHHPELFKDKGKNAYALAWSMYKKGDTPHYKEMPDKDSRKGTPVKKKKSNKKTKKGAKKVSEKLHEKKSKKFNEWAQERISTPDLQLPESTMNFNDLSREELQKMTAFQIMQKIKDRQLPPGVDPLAYAIMLKHGGVL